MDAEAFLESLEPIGWRLGLERMHRLSTLLGMPQHRFASIHVVGTNGKSSVTRMTAALLEARGLRTGACVSPHTSRWSERVLIRGREIDPDAFEAAVERCGVAAETVNRSLEEGEVVTQFELATAAAFVAFAAARVEVAVVEAGLGGRLDATNTIPSRLTALTSVGLDHTEWLGESKEEIAREKLAVLRDHTKLVVGRLDPGIEALARRAAEEHGAELIVAPEDPGEAVRMAAPGRFQRANFALARSVAEAFLGEALPTEVAAEVAAAVRIPGRLEPAGGDPPVYLDAAHNPDGAAALAEALPELAAGRPVVGCIAILADKDAAGIAAALAPALDAVVCSELPQEGPRGRPPVAAAELARCFGRAGLAAAPEPDLEAALSRARGMAAERGGVMLAAGSHYLLAPARRALGLCED